MKNHECMWCDETGNKGKIEKEIYYDGRKDLWRNRRRKMNATIIKEKQI